MLGERTDSASANALVRPSCDKTESRLSSDSTVLDDVSAVMDVSAEVNVSIEVMVSTLGRTSPDTPPGSGEFARLHFSWMGSASVGSAGTGGGWSCAESSESCFLRDLEFSLKNRRFFDDSER